MILRKLREFLRDESGNSLVTLVIACIPMVYILAMIISFGQAFYGVQVAMNASAVGARAAALHSSAASAYTAASEVAKDYTSRAGMGVSFEADDLSYSTWSRKEKFEYSVTVKVKTAMPMNPYGNGIRESFTPTRGCPAIIEGE